MDILYAILLGAFIGWLAGLILKGKGYGAFGNVVIGILGSLLGHYLARLLGLSAQGTGGQLIISLGGAILVVVVLSKLKPAK